jgi:antitoxin component of MazEF toxin-antitoxin module
MRLTLKVKKYGNSLWLLIPKNVLENENIKKDDLVEVEIRRK